jgi:hypothetical protein
VDRAREASEQGAAADSLGALREAWRLDPRSAVIRAVLVSALLEEARRLVETDWEAADRAVAEALVLEPNHAPAQSLASRIADRKREDFIAWCLAQARRMQTEGDLAGAWPWLSRAWERIRMSRASSSCKPLCNARKPPKPPPPFLPYPLPPRLLHRLLRTIPFRKLLLCQWTR